MREELKFNYNLMIGSLGRLSGIHESESSLTATLIEEVEGPTEIFQAIAAAHVPGKQSLRAASREVLEKAIRQAREESLESSPVQAELFAPEGESEEEPA